MSYIIIGGGLLPPHSNTLLSCRGAVRQEKRQRRKRQAETVTLYENVCLLSPSSSGYHCAEIFLLCHLREAEKERRVSKRTEMRRARERCEACRENIQRGP